MNKHLSEFEYRRLKSTEISEKVSEVLQRLSLSDSADAQIKAFKDWDHTMKEWETFASLAHIRFTQNTQDSQHKAEREYYDQLAPLMSGEEQKLFQAVLKSPYRADFSDTFGSNLLRSWELNLKAFDPKITAEKQQEGNLTAKYSELLAGLKVSFRGEEYSLTRMAPFYDSADRQTRLEARQAQDAALRNIQTELDDIFDQLVQLRHNMAVKMGYSSYTEMGYAEMGRVDYGVSEVETFRKQVAEVLVPLASQIIESRKERLGLDDYAYHDESLMDLQGEISPKGDHDWMMDRAQEMFDEMGEDFSDFFTMMRERGLLDLKSRDGKAGGGYCTIFSDHGAPFIFANFNGTQGDVRVFTHECGHAFQCFQSKDVPLRHLIWPTYEAAEIHSMSLEFLSYPWMERFFAEDTERFKRSHLEEAILFIPYGAAVDEFQHMVYANPEANADERAQMWKEMEAKYLPHRKYTESTFFESGRFWQRQGHIYRRPFYYIDYCLAQVCALQFWAMAEDNREEAMVKYRALCKLGGTKPFTGLLNSIDLPSPFVDGTLIKAISVPLEMLGFK